MAITFASRCKEYDALWAGLSIRKENEREVFATARRIMGHRDRYEPVAKATGVPWFVVGIIHSLECSLSFEKHLHNGDPLMRGGKPVKTVRVPAGRGPFESWEESAIDAIRYDKLDKESDWTPARIAYCFERYNGWGYANKGVPSPYLWSFTTAYERGKFVQDGVYSPVAVSKQAGAMAILKAMALSDPTSVRFGDAPEPPAVEFPKAKQPEPPPAPPVVAVVTATTEVAKSPTNWSVVTLLGLVLQGFVDWVSGVTDFVAKILPSVSTEVHQAVEPIQALGQTMQLKVAAIIPAIAIILSLVIVIRNWRNKQTIKAKEAAHVV